MKYFKHFTNALESDSVNNILNELGFEGYGRYWRLLEVLASRFDGINVKFKINRRDLREILRFHSWNKLSTFAERTSNVRGLYLVQVGNVFEIEAPILLELQSRDFKTARSERAQTAPKIKIKNKIYISVLVDTWNELSKKYPDRFCICKDFHEKRKKLLKARLEDHSLEDVVKSLKSLEDADWIGQGKYKKWGIEKILQKDILTRLLEGSYASKTVSDQPNKHEMEGFKF